MFSPWSIWADGCLAVTLIPWLAKDHTLQEQIGLFEQSPRMEQLRLQLEGWHHHNAGILTSPYRDAQGRHAKRLRYLPNAGSRL